MSVNATKAFVHELMNDELLLNRFRSDPEAAIEAADYDFEAEERSALLSRKESRIQEHIGDAKAHLVALFVVVK